jgi:hypothetical protein
MPRVMVGSCMKTCGFIFLCLGLVLIIGVYQEPRLLAQDFPYSVPQAPEFDRRGNHVESAPADTYVPRKRSKRHSEYPGDQADLRAVRPYVPNEPQPMVAPPQPRPEVPPGGYAARSAPATPPNQMQAPPPHHPPAPSAAMQQQPVNATQGRPDCARYPVMIAQARSEMEMRATAQMFLTCLLKNGLTMEQARNYVIMTIETNYRAAR